MLAPQLMKSMDDDHLVASVRAELDPLTSTALELELLGRFEALLDAQNSELQEAVDNFDLEPQGITALGAALIVDARNSAALLGIVGEAGIDDPKELQAELDLAQKFRALTEDAGDVFTRLSQLTTNAQE